MQQDEANPFSPPRANLEPEAQGQVGSLDDALAGRYDYDIGDILSESWAKINGWKGTFWVTAIVGSLIVLGLQIGISVVQGALTWMGLELVGAAVALLGGLAVAIGARVCAAAEGGEILVSSTVRDLVVGSGLGFAYRGAHSLKGLDAEVGAPAAADLELARRCTEGFAAELAALRYDANVVRTALWFDPQSLMAASFTPSAAFQQTPGPRAGAPLAA